MDFNFTAEQSELGAVVRSFLVDQSPESEVRRLMIERRGWEPDTWFRLATEIGVQGLAIPEEFGGSGFGLVELGITFEEMGRALFGAPFLSSIGLGASALMASGDDGACADYLPGIAAGTTVSTLALTEDSGSWTEEAATTRAEHGASGWRIRGRKCYVLDGQSADLLLVVARSAAGIGLFAVDSAADGVEASASSTLDLTRKQASIDLNDAPARLVGEEGAGWPAVEKALQMGAALLAAEQVGGTAAVLAMAVDYTKIRHQFGRPIGSFQAIKHKTADMLLRLEAARSAAHYALWAGSSHGDDPMPAASIAKAYCSEAYTFCAEQNMQIHGGIGFTWEHPTHLYLRRAKSSESLLGSPSFHRDRVAVAVGI